MYHIELQYITVSRDPGPAYLTELTFLSEYEPEIHHGMLAIACVQGGKRVNYAFNKDRVISVITTEVEDE